MTNDWLTSAQSRRLIVCADDYGLSPAVGLGIRELVKIRHLSATSVMSNMRSWPREAMLLREYDKRIAVGLHFTLTDQVPLGKMPSLAPRGRLPSIAELMVRSLTGQLVYSEIYSEFMRQLESFIVHFGRLPDFVDGHHHIHLLPVIRDVALSFFANKFNKNNCWLRSCSDRFHAIRKRSSPVKAGVMSMLSSNIDRQAIKSGIVMNKGFSGFYSKSLARSFKKMLFGAKDQHLLMVHPGYVDHELECSDKMTIKRVEELQFLMSPDFENLVEESGFILDKGPEFPL